MTLKGFFKGKYNSYLLSQLYPPRTVFSHFCYIYTCNGIQTSENIHITTFPILQFSKYIISITF